MSQDLQCTNRIMHRRKWFASHSRCRRDHTVTRSDRHMHANDDALWSIKAIQSGTPPTTATRRLNPSQRLYSEKLHDFRSLMSKLTACYVLNCSLALAHEAGTPHAIRARLHRRQLHRSVSRAFAIRTYLQKKIPNGADAAATDCAILTVGGGLANKELTIAHKCV
jgi:hypothetical protein